MNIDTLDKVYGQLFTDLHQSGLFPDGKVISDAIPQQSPEVILVAYHKAKQHSDFDLNAFFKQYFVVPKTNDTSFQADPSKSAEEHVRSLWQYLSRPADKKIKGSSLLPLPNSYLVPGGRFNEVYYWDSYFSMLGMMIHGQEDLVKSILDNFCWLIDTLGHIPNGNRTYYVSRSQPPFFSLMVQLWMKYKGEEELLHFLPYLEKEYAFWMKEGDRGIKVGSGYLNRYFDNDPKPRAEMYSDDIELKEKYNGHEETLYYHIKAACESGWDFSTRWFGDYKNLITIHTIDLLQVDLNSLLWNLEALLAHAYHLKDNAVKSQYYTNRANNRKILIQQYFWNSEKGFYFDYDNMKKENANSWTLAGIFPLFFGLSSQDQAKKCAKHIEEKFLKPGGVVTTLIRSGQQWDAPNGWAPLQYMTVMALERYGYRTLAVEIANRWLSLCEKVYSNNTKFVEKYNVEDVTLEAGGGEYPVQDGFGWSNGVYIALKHFIKHTQL